MVDIGHASMPVIPTFDGIKKRLEDGTSKHLADAGESGGRRFGDTAGRSAGRRFGSVFKSAAKGALIGAAGAGVLAAKFGKDAIGLASEYEQSVGAVDAVFKKSSKQIHRWADDAATDVGL